MSDKKIKFNIIDAIILLVIVAVVAFVGIKFFGKGEDTASEPKTYYVSFYCEEVPSYAADIVKVGDGVEDETKKVALGTIVEVELGDAAIYSADAEGKVVKSAKEGYKSVLITSEVLATEFEHGIIADSIKYAVGHTVTLYAGNAKMVGRVSEIKVK